MRSLCFAIVMAVAPMASVAAAPVVLGSADDGAAAIAPADGADAAMVDANARSALPAAAPAATGEWQPGSPLVFRWAEEYEQIASFAPESVSGAFGPQSVDSPVPEPATWAMMLFGFGFIGAALRRYRPRRPAHA